MADLVFDQADHFLIPLLDGGYGLGQVLAPATELRSGEPAALCILTSRRATRDEGTRAIVMAEVLSVELVDPAPLADGTWPVIGFEQLPGIGEYSEIIRLTSRDDPGPVVRETGVVEAFVNACHGLYPWDGFGSPDLFDAMLRPGAKRPV